MHPDRHYLRGKLNFITKMVAVIGWLRNQTQEPEQTEPQLSEQAHILAGRRFSCETCTTHCRGWAGRSIS